MYNFEPYNVLLAIATNIPVLLMTASVLQGHKYEKYRVFVNIFEWQTNFKSDFWINHANSLNKFTGMNTKSLWGNNKVQFITSS